MGVSVVILAAGAGTRMKSATPKVLHRICGREMLFFAIDEALCVSDDVHIVLYFEKDLIKKSVMSAYAEACAQGRLHFHIQNAQDYPGTAGALMQGSTQSAKAPLDFKYDWVLILNGDMPLIRAQSLKEMYENPAKIVMSVLELANPYGYGRVIMDNKKVVKIVEQKDATPEEARIQSVNAGVYKIHKSILQAYLPRIQNHNNQREFYLTDVVFYAQHDNVEIAAIVVEECEFMGVNSKVQLACAQEIMLQRLRDKAMEQGVIMHLPHTIYMDYEVRFSGECIIEQGVQILGNSEIKNAHIKAHSVIESSIIESSDIGPLAHIRPKSVIKNTHIGNFVETKSSTLNGVKAGHLSYLGDCEIGSGSNIGAGVITCNYDGKAKHKTTIGQNVFVGSDVQLIAPVNIESNALIGAGSTITKHVKSGDLVLSRTPQKHIENGYFKFFNLDSVKKEQ